MPSHWSQTFHMYVWLFNTGRGLSVCVRFPHNIGLLYDLGASSDFSPAQFVQKHIAPKFTKYKDHSMAQTVLSHPHADHIVEIEAIQAGKPLCPELITCPNDRDPDNGISQEKVEFQRLKNGTNTELLEAYRRSYSARRPPLQTLQAPDISSSLYSYVPTDIEYGLTISDRH